MGKLVHTLFRNMQAKCISRARPCPNNSPHQLQNASETRHAHIIFACKNVQTTVLTADEDGCLCKLCGRYKQQSLTRFQKWSTKSSKGSLVGKPAQEMRTASRTPPQRSWCSAFWFSNSRGLQSCQSLITALVCACWQALRAHASLAVLSQLQGPPLLNKRQAWQWAHLLRELGLMQRM